MAPRVLLAAMLSLLSVFPAGAQSPSPQGEQPPSENLDIQRLLDRRAAAVTNGNLSAFEATMDGAPDDYRTRQRRWFQRIRALPLERYELKIGDEEFGNLARGQDRRRGIDEVRVLQVSERIKLRGYDQHPTNEDIFFTFERRVATWSVVGDESVVDLGLRSSRNLWDFGEVRVLDRDGILIVYHPSEASAAQTIMTQARRARDRVRGAWPFDWSGRIIIMVPTTVEELERILQTTFDLTSFVAFAASSVDREEGFRLTGDRVFLHWPNFRNYSDSFQTSILSHEFLHIATRSIAGPYITAIMDEGVAQHYGEGGGETERLRRRVRNGTLPGSLVPDWFFVAGPREDIFLAYEEAASFIRYIDRRFGRNAGARMYRALGTIDPVGWGTWRYHLDRVTQELFKQPYPALEQDWFRTVSRELR